MNDQLISTGKVAAFAAWIVGGLLLTAGWVIGLDLPGDRPWRWCVLLLATGLAIIGVAMVLQIRCYILRLLAVIRVMAGIEDGGERGELHSLP
jgi:hypothetical protein